ncbi:MAG: electron transport complex subunit RsxC, partial [Gammaproteobacteria bacterium]|nr:electron transport complex subunit RsxC [Gammaproteobacteria bacterium]
MAEQRHKALPMIPPDFERRYRFHGGLKLAACREQTSARPIRTAGIPAHLVLPLQQHIGEPAECLVNPGDTVYKGQLIAQAVGAVSAPVHASSSGTVVAVEDRPVPHPSGLPARCIVIETDGKDSTANETVVPVDYAQTDPAILLDRIRAAGIVGLGGAGFPTRVKLARHEAIELLLINGAECEPCISCDNSLLRERAEEVIEGVRILRHIVQPQACVIALEDNMPEAEQALRAALEALDEHNIIVATVPTIYPTGGERQLIKVLTNREVPSQGFPADIGIVCQNVGTAAAVYHAVTRSRPLLSRIVTVTGDGVLTPCNMEALIGTPVSDLVAAAGGYTDRIERLLIGGPMMGYAVNTDAVPLIKTTNCVLAVTEKSMPAPPPAQPCIRCGKCTEVCPADLLPQQLYWYASSSNYDAAQDFGLFDCIECGCCSHVCPSHIPLVQYYRHAKTSIWAQEKQKKASDIARERHEARQARLERIKQERAEKLARKKQALSEKSAGDNVRNAAIQAALERVKHKKEQAGMETRNTDNLT